MPPTASGAHRGGASSRARASDSPAVGGDQCLPGKPDAVENDIRGAPVVDGAVTVHLQAGWGAEASNSVANSAIMSPIAAVISRWVAIGADMTTALEPVRTQPRRRGSLWSTALPSPPCPRRRPVRRRPIRRRSFQHRRRGLPIGAGQQPRPPPRCRRRVRSPAPAQFLGDHHDLDRPAAAAAGRFRQ